MYITDKMDMAAIRAQDCKEWGLINETVFLKPWGIQIIQMIPLSLWDNREYFDQDIKPLLQVSGSVDCSAWGENTDRTGGQRDCRARSQNKLLDIHRQGRKEGGG